MVPPFALHCCQAVHSHFKCIPSQQDSDGGFCVLLLTSCLDFFYAIFEAITKFGVVRAAVSPGMPPSRPSGDHVTVNLCFAACLNLRLATVISKPMLAVHIDPPQTHTHHTCTQMHYGSQITGEGFMDASHGVVEILARNLLDTVSCFAEHHICHLHCVCLHRVQPAFATCWTR